MCAYALRQWDLGAELSGGVGVSPFVRALLLSDGAVSVLDRRGIYFTRAWCLLELWGRSRLPALSLPLLPLFFLLLPALPLAAPGACRVFRAPPFLGLSPKFVLLSILPS